MNIQDWFSLGLTGFILSPRDSGESSPTPQFKNISLLYGPNLTAICDYWKTIALTRWIFVSKVMSLFFLIHCLGFSELSLQWAHVILTLGLQSHPQWFWSPRKLNLPLLPFKMSRFNFQRAEEVMRPWTLNSSYTSSYDQAIWIFCHFCLYF